MKTLSDLGRLVKDEYPDYEDLSDEEVGRLVKEQYPGQYDDFVEPLSIQPDTPQNIQQLLDYYDPGRGRLSSWWQRGKAESRNRLLEALNVEQRSVIERGAILEQSVRQHKKDRAEFQVFIAENALRLLEIQHTASLTESAMQKSLTVSTDQEVKRERLLSNIKIDEHQRRVEIDLDGRWKSIVQDLDAADLLQISERQVIRKLLTELSDARRERHGILNGEDAEEVKKQILADYDKHITNLELHLDARQTRLLLSENGQEARRLEEGAPDSGDDS